MIKDLNRLFPNLLIPATSAGVEFGGKGVSASLAGRLLVASSKLQDIYFARTVIYVCVHNITGAMGIIINNPISNLNISDIMEQVGIEEKFHRDVQIHSGGPLEGNRGFILHSDDFIAAGSIYQGDGITVTCNAEVLKEIANGKGPSKSLLALGYAGWGIGQLESEIESGAWMIVPADKDIIFGDNNEKKWQTAINSLGFDIGNLSTVAGHA